MLMLRRFSFTIYMACILAVPSSLLLLNITTSTANCQTIINSVKFVNGKLHVTARQASLKKVLEKVEKLTNIKIHTTKLTTDKLIDAEIETDNVEKGIVKLLKNTNYRLTNKINNKSKHLEVFLYENSGEENLTKGDKLTKIRRAGSETVDTNSEKALSKSVDKASFPKKTEGVEIVSHQIMVRFSPGLPEGEANKEIAKSTKYSFKAVRVGTLGFNYYKVLLSSGEDDKRVLSTLLKSDNVISGENDFIVKIDITPSDPKYADQWGLEKIQAPQAWDKTTGSPSIVVAVIDTGVEYTHPDLENNIWHNPEEIADNKIDDDDNGYVDDTIGYDFVTISDSYVYAGEDAEPIDNDPMDLQGHGTHVAGIIAAEGNNGIGVSGVNWGCKVMPLRAGFKNSSGGGSLLNSDIVRAITYAADNGADVISMSFGSSYNSSSQRDAIEYAAQKGVVLVGASGNSGRTTKHYPAAYDDVISVGATTSSDSKASFSNYGDWVTISAPGSGIWSTYIGGRYTALSGTSMATPIVAGVAALVLSHSNSLSPTEVRNLMVNTADAVSVDYFTGKDPEIGGRINANAAIDGISEGLANQLGPPSQVPTIDEWGALLAFSLISFTASKNQKTTQKGTETG